MFDLIVIGAGPGGYLAAERAAHEGLKVALIEKRFIGGVCLNEGCIPTKTFLYSAKLKDGAAHGDKYGVHTPQITINHKEVVARKRKVVKTLTGGVGATLKALGVEIVMETAQITGKDGDNFVVQAGEKELKAPKLIVATGSSALLPPIDGLREQYQAGFALTNREILDLEEAPEALVVIGGGVIGLEMASYFNSLGCGVAVVEMLDKIAGATDGDISKQLQKEYEAKGVHFQLGSKVIKLDGHSVYFEKEGQTYQIECDKVLVSIGRGAFTKNLGLETIGVATERGAILTNEKMQTNVSGVYAVGDVNGKSLLAHTAYREAEVAVNNIVGKPDVMSYAAIPSVIYTNPEVASVGETEESAKAKGIDVIAKSVSMRYSGRYVAENEGKDGVCKVVVDKHSGKLIGVSLIANYASELIYGAGTMIEEGMTVAQIKKIVFPHPTVCEIIREAIFQF